MTFSQMLSQALKNPGMKYISEDSLSIVVFGEEILHVNSIHGPAYVVTKSDMQLQWRRLEAEK